MEKRRNFIFLGDVRDGSSAVFVLVLLLVLLLLVFGLGEVEVRLRVDVRVGVFLFVGLFFAGVDLVATMFIYSIDDGACGNCRVFSEYVDVPVSKSCEQKILPILSKEVVVLHFFAQKKSCETLVNKKKKLTVSY